MLYGCYCVYVGSCGPGSSIDVFSQTCVKCDKQSYQNLVNQLSCKSCPVEYHTKEPGATDESMCQAGKQGTLRLLSPLSLNSLQLLMRSI